MERMKRMSREWLARFIGVSTLLAMFGLVSGCSSDPNPKTRFKPIPEGTAGPSLSKKPGLSTPDYKLTVLVGDWITITFTDVPPPFIPEQRVQVPEDGMITLPHNVQIRAVGKTTTQLEREIRAAYVPSIFVQLTATVKTEQRVFFVDGEVRQPSRQPFSGEMTVLRAITTVGGFTDFANRKRIEIRRQSGEKILVNWFEALDDPGLDLPIFPNDYIVVKRKLL